MSDNINFEESKKGYINIIQVREFLNKNIYKIGRTGDVKTRINGYPKNSKLLFIIDIDMEDLVDTETELINIFKDYFNHKNEYGREYFEGDLNEMIKIINEYLEFKNKFVKFRKYLEESNKKKINKEIKLKKNENVNIENVNIENINIENTNIENTNNENTNIENVNIENTSNENTNIENR